MSKKFGKNRSVDWRYLHVPLKYQDTVKFVGNSYDKETGIRITDKKLVDKDLVVVDDYGKILVCAIRNNITCRCGRTFICKKIYKKDGIYFKWKNKLYKYSSRSGWVWLEQGTIVQPTNLSP